MYIYISLCVCIYIMYIFYICFYIYIYINIYMKKVYLEECSSLFMEAEKFHNLLSTWCKARKASD